MKKQEMTDEAKKQFSDFLDVLALQDEFEQIIMGQCIAKRYPNSVEANIFNKLLEQQAIEPLVLIDSVVKLFMLDAKMKLTKEGYYEE